MSSARASGLLLTTMRTGRPAFRIASRFEPLPETRTASFASSANRDSGALDHLADDGQASLGGLFGGHDYHHAHTHVEHPPALLQRHLAPEQLENRRDGP